MKARHYLEVMLHNLDGPLPGSRAFQAGYAGQRVGPTTTFAFEDEQMLMEALSFLAQFGLKSRQFFVFDLEPSEVAAFPAIYLGVHVVDDLVVGVGKQIDASQLDHRGMAVDYHTEALVVSRQVQEILLETTTGLHWTSMPSTDGKDRSVVHVHEYLPDPIVVPVPLFVGPNESPVGTYAVQSDGRDIVTAVNADRLRQVGLAASLEVRIPSGVLNWRPRLVASGAVVAALQSANVRGLLEPLTPLLLERHVLSQ
jgi:hypothetical protein